MKRLDVGMLFQQCANDIALHAFAFAVDQAHFVKSGSLTLGEIFFDHTGNVFGLKRMEIEVILNGKNDRIIEGRFVCQSFDYAIDRGC